MAVNESNWSRLSWIPLAILSMAAGCVEVNGGAVELSWVIRDANGANCECGEATILFVALNAQSCDSRRADGSCDGVSEARPGVWACEDKHGITGFELAEGRWAFTIQPIRAEGSTVETDVPPPVIRDVIEGEPTQLDALLIVANGLDCRVPD